MTIQFQLELQDFFAMQKNVINQSRTHEIKRKYFSWGISIVLLAALLLLLKMSFVNAIISIIVAAIFFLVAPMLYPKIAFAKLKGQIENSNYTNLLKPCEMHFTEDGIDRIIDGETTHFPWNGFRKLQEDESHYFLYVDDLQGIIIPKEPTVKHSDSKSFQEKLLVFTDAHFALENSTK